MRTTSKIKTTTIDSELKDCDIENFILCIKLDIEGSEFDAIKGASIIIKKYAPIFIIEISKYNINQMNLNLEFFKNFLIENDYIIFDLFQDQVQVDDIKKRINEVGFNNDTIGNFYLLKNDDKIKKFFKKDE